MKTKKSAIKKTNPHSKYSPSMLEHLEVCPGYEKESGDNIFSLEGEMMHKACETGKLDKLDPEQLGCVQKCLDYIFNLTSADRKLFMDKKEVRLDVEGMTWGTADRLIVHQDGSASLVDFKFGRNPVDDAETNLQGWCYALGTFYKFPKIKTLVVHFLLPRRDEISTAEFARNSELATQIRLRIKTVIARRKEYEARPSDDMLNARIANCLYCGAKAKCQKLHSIAFKIAQKYDETFDIPEEVHSSQIQDPNEMAKAKAIANVMDRWAGSVSEHALQMVLSGTEIPGWELKTRMGRLRIQDAAAAFTAVKNLFNGITLEEFVCATSVSKSALDKFVSDRAEKGEKSRSVQELNEALIETGIGVRDPDTNYLSRIKG